MTAKSLRILCFYGMHLVYFPLLIASLTLFTRIREFAPHLWPAWLNALATFLVAAGLYVYMGYALARSLDRREKQCDQ
jgi:uncharacterized protein (DUF58 family)